MKYTVKRDPSTDAGTPGVGTLDDGGKSFDSLELPNRGNAPGLSCILAGVYQAMPVMSPHFGCELWRLLDVPGRSYIEIHPADWAGDVNKGLYCDLMGCFGVGYGTGLLQPPEPKYAPQMAILNSRAAFKDFMARTTANGNLSLTVEVIDAPASA